jgi:hypothetical protein
MRKIVRLTERDLSRIVRRVIREQIETPLDKQTREGGELAKTLSNKIVNLFKDSKFWQPYKSVMGDNEEVALKAYDNWWKTNIEPYLSKTYGEKDLRDANQRIRKALLGNESSDSVRWFIKASYGTGPKKEFVQHDYEVNTDF